MKRGVSLIAVLMFMLAATTASIVVFRWIGQEGFASGARLKSNEAYQASQAGLDAVQGWLTNRGAEVGILINTYDEELKGQGRPILLDYTKTQKDIGGKQQNYKVYLISVEKPPNPNTITKPLRLKFISEGEARDGSKYTQVGIFEVTGLYKTIVRTVSKKPPDPDFNQAFYGGISGNTQAKWSSAIVNGDLVTNGEGIRTTGSTIVTGSVSGNGFGSCGHNGEELKANILMGTNTNNVYIAKDLSVTRFYVCGSAYVGGKISGNNSNGDNFYIKGDLYTVGGIDGQITTAGEARNADATLGTINGNFTTCGDVNITNAKSPFVVKGHVRMEETNKCSLPPISPPTFPDPNPEFNFRASNDKQIIFGDNSNSIFWSFTDVIGIVGCGTYPILGRGGFYFPGTLTPSFRDSVQTKCKAFNNRAGGLLNFNKNVITNLKTYNDKSLAKAADTLPELSGKIDPDQSRVPDPLILDEVTKQKWYKLAAQLLDSANNTDIGKYSSLDSNCIYLLKTRNSSSTWAKDQNSYCKSMQSSSVCQGKFVQRLNGCYAALKAREENNQSISPKYLYKGTETSSELFLPLALELNNATDKDVVSGNFIWIFDLNTSAVSTPPTTDLSSVIRKPGAIFGTVKLPVTDDNAKVLVYLPLGASKLEFTNKGKTHNYFIFSDGNIDEAAGETTINGSVFLAQKCGASGTEQCSIGNLPDTELKFNADLYNALKEAGILTGNPEYNSGSENTPSSSSSSESSSDDIVDPFWIPSAPHLKVTLQSKYKSQEAVNPDEIKTMDQAILVLPRIIYLPEGQSTPSPEEMKKYYTVLYFGLSPSANQKNAEASASCSDGKVCTLTSNICQGDGCKQHNFYIGSGTVGPTTPTAKLVVKGGGERLTANGTCAEVYVQLENPATKPTTVEVAVTTVVPNSEYWTISPQSSGGSSITNTIAENALEVKVFTICLKKEGADDIDVQLITRTDGTALAYLPGNPSYVKISENVASAEVELRRPASPNWVSCPSLVIGDAIWADVTCENKRTPLPNSRWTCKANSSATFITNDVVPGCEPSVTSLPVTVPAAGDWVPVEADLKWKTATVTVDGDRSLTLKQPNPLFSESPYSIPSEVVCAPTSPCEIYQGINYIVSLSSGTEAKMWNCSNPNYCENSSSINNLLTSGWQNNTSNLLKAFGDVTITISDPPPATLVDCVLLKTRMKTTATLKRTDIREPTISYLPATCDRDNLGIEYFIEDTQISFPYPAPASSTEPLLITAKATQCGDLGPSECGTLYISDEGCDYNGWCGSAAKNINKINGTYTTGIVTNAEDNANGPACFYATDISKLGNATGPIRVNGVTFSGDSEGKGRCGNTTWGQKPCSAVLNEVTLADDGYYIYTANWWGDFSLTLATSPCEDEVKQGEVEAPLTCNLAAVKSGRGYSIQDIITCPPLNGKTANSIFNTSWTNAPPKYEGGQFKYDASDWFTWVATQVEGTYNDVSVEATCSYNGENHRFSGTCTPNPWTLDNSAGAVEGDLDCHWPSGFGIGNNQPSNPRGNILNDLLTCPTLGGASGTVNSARWTGQPGGTNFPVYIAPNYTGSYDISVTATCQYPGGTSKSFSAECPTLNLSVGDFSGPLLCNLSTLRLGNNSSTLTNYLTCPTLDGISATQVHTPVWTGTLPDAVRANNDNFPSTIAYSLAGIYSDTRVSVTCEYPQPAGNQVLGPVDCTPNSLNLGGDISLSCVLPINGAFEGGNLVNVNGLFTCFGGAVGSTKTIVSITPTLTNQELQSLPVGEYSDITISTTCGGVSKTADCDGTLTVHPISMNCNLPTGVQEDTTLNMAQYISCNNGTTPRVDYWTVSPQANITNNVWSNISAGTYTITANGACSNISKSASCGTFEVVASNEVPVCLNDVDFGDETTNISQSNQIPDRTGNMSDGDCANIKVKWNNSSYFAPLSFACKTTSGNATITLSKDGVRCIRGTANTGTEVSCPLGTVKSGLNSWIVHTASTSGGTFVCEVK